MTVGAHLHAMRQNGIVGGTQQKSSQNESSQKVLGIGEGTALLAGEQRTRITPTANGRERAWLSSKPPSSARADTEGHTEHRR